MAGSPEGFDLRPLPDALWGRLAAFRRRVMRGMQGGLSAIVELGLTLPQSLALFRLVERGPASISELQIATGRSQAATSHLVDRLERRGLVVRRPDPADRRCSAVHATDEAMEFVRRVEGVRRRGVEEVLGRVPPEVVRAFDEALAAVLAALEDE